MAGVLSNSTIQPTTMAKQNLGGMTAHAWAHQTQDSGQDRSGGGFFFRGRTIFSYGSHFPIATIDDVDPDIVWFTYRTYSNTTSGHIAAARGAVSHKTLVYVSKPLDSGNPRTDKTWQQNEISNFVSRIKNILPDLAKARKPQKYLDEINVEMLRLKRFIMHTDAKISKALQAFMDNPTGDSINKFYTDLEAQERRAEKAAIKANAKADAEKISKWKAGDQRSLYIVGNYTYLRVSGDKVETSKGIELSLAVAKRYFEKILSVTKDGQHCTDCNFKMMDFAVKEITPDHLLVGCHDIPMSEIKSIAQQLGWA